MLEAEHQRQVDELIGSLPQTRSRYFYRSVVVRERFATGNRIRAGGQLLGGESFPAAGSGFFWVDGEISASVSLSVGWGPATATMTRGTAGIQGRLVGIPANLVNRNVHLYSTGTFWIREIRIERSDNDRGPWQHVSTGTTTLLHSRAWSYHLA